MASPVDAGRIATNISTAADPWVINLPGSIAAGDLLLMFHRGASGSGLLNASGFTQITSSATDASDDLTAIKYKLADGTETSTVSIGLTPAAAAKGAVIVWRITGAIAPGTQLPEFSTVAIGTAANADSTAVTPTGGSKDYLFLALVGMDHETATFTQPAGYTNLVQANSGTAGAVATNCQIAAASKQATASTEDPAAWTSTAATTGWTAWTLAIHPDAAAAITVIPVGFATGRDY